MRLHRGKRIRYCRNPHHLNIARIIARTPRVVVHTLFDAVVRNHRQQRHRHMRHIHALNQMIPRDFSVHHILQLLFKSIEKRVVIFKLLRIA